MADGYIDLSPIVNAINGIGRQVSSVGYEVTSLKSDVDKRMTSLKSDLEILKRDFVQMVEENRKQAALQRALTEIIRVRQELERDYGNYKQVRQTMLGILQATDLELVRQTTIETCTEELMLKTPQYWLAPVLIALSAWISDNKSLATRALQEALRRDDEKTSLTFALICRRNKRTKACFQWLARYFAMQKANAMKESIIAYIDAYTNGVFGEDKDNLCEEYIQQWMGELQHSNENFEEEQVQYWKHVYETYCHDTSKKYPKLAECAKPEFTKMNDYVMRCNAAPEIIEFFANILGTEVDEKTLVDKIDEELIKLVSNYDVQEAPLREEEEYLSDVKKYEGDEKRAKQLAELRKARRADNEVDLAERLSRTIISNSSEDISAKKTAIRFMQSYIKDAFKEFVEEKAPAYPTEITIKTHGWEGKTKDGSNQKALQESYEQEVNGRRANELAGVTNKKMWTFFGFAIAGVVLLIIGIALAAAKKATGFGIFLIILGIGLGVAFLIAGFVTKKKNAQKRLSINGRYDRVLNEGLNDIKFTIEQKLAMDKIAQAFQPEECCEKLLLTEGTLDE